MYRKSPIRTRLLASFIALSIIPFAIVGIISLLSYSQALSASAFGQLESLREIKKTQIEQFFAERQKNMGVLMETVASLRQAAFDNLSSVAANKKAQIKEYFNKCVSDIAVISRNTTVLNALEDFRSVFGPTAEFDETLYDFFEKVKYGDSLQQYQKVYGYYDLLLVTVAGNVVFSLNRESDLGQNLIHGPLRSQGPGRCFAAALSGIDLQDFESYAPSQNQPVAFIGAPITQKYGQVAGVVILKLSKSAINTIVQRREGMGGTGETYLVGRKLGRPVLRSDQVVWGGRFGDPVKGDAVELAFQGRSEMAVKPSINDTMEIVRYDPLEIVGHTWAMINTISLEEVIAPKLHAEAEDYFSNYIKSYGYTDLLLITPSGIVFYSVSRDSDYGANLVAGELIDTGLGRLFTKTMATKAFSFIDFQPYQPAGGYPTAFIGQPVIHHGKVELVVALRLSIDTINTVMQERSGMGRSGETYLIGPDLRMRSDSYLAPNRFSLGASFHNDERGRIETTAGREALAGKTGEKIIRNYNGDEVLSAYTPLTVWDTTWALIAEVSTTEAFASVRLLRLIVIIIGTAGIVAIIAISFFIARKVSRPIKQLTEATEAVTPGRLDIVLDENLINSGDEIGTLANAFNTMTARLKQSMEDLKAQINERRLAEQESMRLATAIDQAAESVIISDADGTIQYVNPAFEKLIGSRRDEVVGHNFRLLKNDLHDEHFYQRMYTQLANGQVWAGRIRNRTKDGRECLFETRISPVRDSSGRIVNFVSVNRDVTQEVVLESQLQQAHKMESIGTLAGGIAHDFNNILGIILGNVELAMGDVPHFNPAYQNLEQVHTASLRAKDVVRQLLSFARKTAEERQPIDLRPVVEESVKLIRASTPSSIEIRYELPPDIKSVMGDATQIHQILINLGTNAAHAMENGGRLSFLLTQINMDESAAAAYHELKPGPFVKLSVKDTGKGIAAEYLGRIFDPYFTTKAVDKGTGMGLAVVHGIVKAHDGAIMVDSTPGLGTAFEIYFPAMDAPPTVKAKLNDELPRGDETILFVDDEQYLLTMSQQGLKRLGYTVKAKTDPIEALALFKAAPERFDLVITDMTMPGLSGEELAMAIFQVRPEIPIILCTGYSSQVDETKAKILGFFEYQEKPIPLQELAKMVRRALDAA